MSAGPARPAAVVAIFGPTGVGKTAVAIELAQLLRARGENPVAISADALQVYQGLGTLTGAATEEERGRLEHRLLGFVPVTETFSVGAFMPLAHAEIDSALESGRRPIVVGGTGLYLRAALTELDLGPQASSELRERLEEELRSEGPARLHARLASRAPAVAATIDPGDRSRVVRALELAELEALQPHEDESQLWTGEVRHPTLLVGLTMEREALYHRIDRRVDEIVAAGALDEVKAAEAAGASRTARKALGFEELLDGDVPALKRRNRNYAKRQLTWMRKLPRLLTIDAGIHTQAKVAQKIEARLADLDPARAAEPPNRG